MLISAVTVGATPIIDSEFAHFGAAPIAFAWSAVVTVVAAVAVAAEANAVITAVVGTAVTTRSG
jgi:hypothetical protein